MPITNYYFVDSVNLKEERFSVGFTEQINFDLTYACAIATGKFLLIFARYYSKLLVCLTILLVSTQK